MRPTPSRLLAGPVVPFVLVSALAVTAACSSSPEDPASIAAAEETIGTVRSAAVGDIAEVTDFGSNPGALKMFEHVPAKLAASPATVLVLHGCTEGAANAAKTGWNELSEEHGFVVVYPEQQTGNNPLRCFNWSGEYGDPTNLQRGKGENLSIKQMVDKTIAAHGGDPTKVYITGFSAGGAEAVLMAAVYPDVFAAAASIAGIPYYCTSTFSEVSSCQKPGKSLAADVWSKKVKDAYPGYAGPWPRISVWQGDADAIVGTGNRTEIVKQWTDLHGLSAASPSATDTVDGQARSVWKDASNVAKVETYVVAGMGHGVPVKPSAQCGTAGSYAIDRGICAPLRIAEFFGLTQASSSSSGGDGGASGKPASSSSTSASSSGGDGGASSGGGSSGNAATGDDDTGYGRAASTCSFAPPRPSRAPVSLVGLLALSLLLGRRARARRAA